MSKKLDDELAQAAGLTADSAAGKRGDDAGSIVDTAPPAFDSEVPDPDAGARDDG